MPGSTHNAFLDYYRCPEAFVNFTSAPSGGTGFFRFGKAICYGQCSTGVEPLCDELPLPDALAGVRFGNGSVHLPFDLTRTINNLRFERYLPSRRTFTHPTAQRAYYAVRRFLPSPIRSFVQRASYRGWESVPFPRWPVDRTVEDILETLWTLLLKSSAASIPFIWFWPEGHDAAAMVTHDVDTEDGLRRCSGLMDIDWAFGIPSAFQIVPEKRYAGAEAAVCDIRRRDFEVNVHDLDHDGLLFRDATTFQRRARRINHYLQQYRCSGFRSGMMYRNLDWSSALHAAYDMSVPSVAHLEPQQGGCCTVMPFFADNTVELPLTTTQDYALFHVLRDHSTALWRKQTELILQKHGLASFIVHPDYVTSEQTQTVYKDLLSYLSLLRSERALWIASPGEIHRWWRQRSQMRLVQIDGHWHIEGEGRERACIAYARLVNDKLTYAVPVHRSETLSQAAAS